MNKENSILEVKDLSIAFGGRTVVEKVNFSLERGRTLGIVGESGSGKSVSTLALMGLLPKQASVTGSAILSQSKQKELSETASFSSDSSDCIEKINLLTLDEALMREVRGKRISMIFQEPMTSLNPVQKCGAQVMEMIKEENEKHKERVIELFKEVLLPRPEKIYDSYPHELSGGQKQRVMIAMALINHPDILIADEPTTALDVTVQKTILELLKSLQEKYGTSIIFITHDLGVISQIADDILVMYRGHMVEQGPAEAILHHPQQPYTQGLLACRPPLDSKPRRLPTVEEYLENSSISSSPSPASPTNKDGQPLIEVRDLDVTYTLKRSLFGRPLQTLKGVDGVSFDIMEGETLGLVGESGCGKTTLGRALLRLIDHSSGSVSYRGTPLDKLDAKPLKVHRTSTTSTDSLAKELMEQVGLQAEWYNRYPHELSGGQRQRVCIARALILQPELVVCDESVSALDVSVQAQVLNLLNDLKERYRFTYLFITHDLSVVHYMADRIMVMQKGKIVESGTPDDIFHNPQTTYTRTLIDAIPKIS